MGRSTGGILDSAMSFAQSTLTCLFVDSLTGISSSTNISLLNVSMSKNAWNQAQGSSGKPNNGGRGLHHFATLEAEREGGNRKEDRKWRVRHNCFSFILILESLPGI